MKPEAYMQDGYIQGCTGKRSYDKKGAITACNKRYAEDHTLLRIYACHGHWHLTKQLRGQHKGHKFKKTVRAYTFDKE